MRSTITKYSEENPKLDFNKVLKDLFEYVKIFQKKAKENLTKFMNSKIEEAREFVMLNPNKRESKKTFAIKFKNSPYFKVMLNLLLQLEKDPLVSNQDLYVVFLSSLQKNFGQANLVDSIFGGIKLYQFIPKNIRKFYLPIEYLVNRAGIWDVNFQNKKLSMTRNFLHELRAFTLILCLKNIKLFVPKVILQHIIRISNNKSDLIFN